MVYIGLRLRTHELTIDPNFQRDIQAHDTKVGHKVVGTSTGTAQWL